MSPLKTFDLCIQGSPASVSSGVPSDRLAEILEQLGTLNNRHEQLRALVEALEVKFISVNIKYLIRLFSLERKT